MTWDEAIKLLDELHVENERPPLRVIEMAREKMRAMKTLCCSAPSSMECSPNGDVFVVWKLPRFEVRLCFWSDGDVKAIVFDDGTSIVASADSLLEVGMNGDTFYAILRHSAPAQTEFIYCGPLSEAMWRSEYYRRFPELLSKHEILECRVVDPSVKVVPADLPDSGSGGASVGVEMTFEYQPPPVCKGFIAYD